MGREEAVKRAVGKADAFELLSCAFAYPDERLAQGLVDGSFADDAGRVCSMRAPTWQRRIQWLNRLPFGATQRRPNVLADMRIVYSRLYLAPGGHTPIFPYESAFLHVERGMKGVPALFRTPVTLDVERLMREAGVVAKNARKEPCDSVFEEFEFLSYLYAKLADALNCDDAEAVAAWTERIQTFEREHAQAWLPAFMQRTQELAAEKPYCAFAALALTVMEVHS